MKQPLTLTDKILSALEEPMKQYELSEKLKMKSNSLSSTLGRLKSAGRIEMIEGRYQLPGDNSK